MSYIGATTITLSQKYKDLLDKHRGSDESWQYFLIKLLESWKKRIK